MPLNAGDRLGHYGIQSPLGAGGMGEVYKATDTRLDRTVAIKVLLAHVADDPELRQRFEREAKTISSLNHPHICTLRDIGSTWRRRKKPLRRRNDLTRLPSRNHASDRSSTQQG